MIYRYESVNGSAIEVEIAEEWGEILIELDSEERRNNKRNTGANRERRSKDTGKRQKIGRNIPLSAFEFLDGALFSDKCDILADIIEDEYEAEKRAALRLALILLKPDERALLEQIFIHKKKAVDIARETGKSEAAVSQWRKRIYNKIKKHLPDGVIF
jgi:RNA polymerase sigma factor (sigma-70 family)